jgi:hypothetical protein
VIAIEYRLERVLVANYQDMCDAARKARTEFFAYRDRCYRYLGMILGGLASHCQVPDDEVKYLKWNEKFGEERWYRPAEEGRVYTFPGATVFDESDGFWHLGVRIGLTPKNEFPKAYVTFVLCVAEQGEAVLVKMGIDAKPKAVLIEEEAARNVLCESIAEGVIAAFAETKKKPSSGTIGFHANLE